MNLLEKYLIEVNSYPRFKKRRIDFAMNKFFINFAVIGFFVLLIKFLAGAIV